MSDWIKLHRQIQHHEWWLAERFTKSQAWIDLLMLAGHKDKTIFVRGNEVRLKRGEFIHSHETLAERWRWNKRTVARFLQMLEEREMLHRRKSNICTVNTILKYDEYQASAPQSAPQDTPQSAPQSIRRVHPNKKEKKDKNEKKEKNIILAEASPPQQTVVKMIEIFRETNPTLQYNNKSERSACERLIQQIGEDSALNACKAAVMVQGENFAPIITKPTELERSITKLRAFMQRKTTEVESTGIIKIV